MVLALSGAEWTALAGVLSGAVVGVGGLAFSYFNSKQERVHAERLAEGQREHDIQTRRSERQYQDRRDTYLDLLRALLILAEGVDLTEPLMTWEGMPEPPEPPSNEDWRDLQARVVALGSEPVNEAADALNGKLRDFRSAVMGYRISRDNLGGDLEGTTKRMLESREEFGTALRQLERLVRQELATL